MRLRVDREAGALHLRLDDSRTVDPEEVPPGVAPDFDKRNRVVGVEVLNLSKRTRDLDLGELH